MGDGVARVFDALGDPSRRHVLELLSERPGATQTELAGELPVTRQAVAKHLAALRAAGLVSVERHGREARYLLEAAPLADAAGWLERVGTQWDERLAALARHVEARRRPEA